MMLPVVIFLCLCMALSFRIKGPIWAFCIAWLVSLLPISFGIIEFSSLIDPGFSYSLTLIAYLVPFILGCSTYHLLPRQLSAPPARSRLPELPGMSMQIVWVCWLLGMAGASFLVIDFYVLGGVGLSDLAALRDTFVSKTSASIFSQLASVMTWACLYTYVFVIYYRQYLNRLRMVILLLPIGGYFLLSLLSAGRQAAFQVMLVTMLTVLTGAARRRFWAQRRLALASRPSSSKLLIAGVSTAMIGYMGFVAVTRNDGLISDDKSEVLQLLFDFKLDPVVSLFGELFGASLKSVLVEAIVYFSSSVAIFQQFLTLEFERTYAAMTLPFFMRQIQGLTGISPSDAMITRADALNELGVIGAGWSTAYSGYLMDFGAIGTTVFLLFSGYYSSYAWQRALRSDRFEDVMIGVLVLVSALYTPLFAAVSDNNLLFSWIFCMVTGYFLRRSQTVALSGDTFGQDRRPKARHGKPAE